MPVEQDDQEGRPSPSGERLYNQEWIIVAIALATFISVGCQLILKTPLAVQLATSFVSAGLFHLWILLGV